MNSKDIKTRILQLAESDPDGFGLLAEQLGKEEWDRCASHAAGFLSSWFYHQHDERGEATLARAVTAEKLAAAYRARGLRLDQELDGLCVRCSDTERDLDVANLQLQKLVKECISVTEECIKLFESYGADPSDSSLPVKNAVALVDKLKKLSVRDI